ncbi:hypothetical protein [Salmonirosea aquatica]|uniref:Carboxypeptidase regulatory-like domain-containing protein n=1 Tax=Salmonirosea aquatica TaxID=2654236 RepID=A0A7C9FPE0_9BACT|nr:hypothetical protein [Cytophagaceae bacterium SJW1-29]
MKPRQIPWGRVHPIHRLLGKIGLAYSPIIIVLLIESCRNKEVARLTTVYGKVTDQAGQPVDSVTIGMQGYEGWLGGLPIDKVYTNQKGEYELVVDVPLRYSYAGVQLNFEYRSLLDSYYDWLIYKNDVKTGDCCIVTMGGKTKYDFTLLPK